MNKRGIAMDYLAWILLALAALAIMVIVIFLLREKGISLIDTLKNLFKS